MPDELTNETLAELARLEAAATAGPWGQMRLYWLLRFGRKNDGPWDDVPDEEDAFIPNSDDDAAFIAALRNAAPALLSEIERLRAELAHATREKQEAEAALKRMADLVNETADLKAKIAAQTQSYQSARTFWPEGQTQGAWQDLLNTVTQELAAARAEAALRVQDAEALRALLGDILEWWDGGGPSQSPHYFSDMMELSVRPALAPASGAPVTGRE